MILFSLLAVIIALLNVLLGVTVRQAFCVPVTIAHHKLSTLYGAFRPNRCQSPCV